jgi:hypothetical protein
MPDAGVLRDATLPDGNVDAGDAAPPDAALPATPCAADRDCAAGTVCRADARTAPVDLAPVTLVCAPPGPGPAADGARCGGADGSGCARGFCVVAGTCVAPCSDDADCAPDARCADAFVRTAPAALQPLRACLNRLAVPPDVRLRVDPDIVEAPGGEVTVDVTLPHEAAVSLGVFFSPRGIPLFAPTLRGPDGATLFDIETLVPGAAPPRNPIAPTGDLLTVLLPSADDTPRGTYTLALAAASRSSLGRIVLTREARGRTLDVDLYLVAGRYVVADGAPLAPELADAIEVFRATYAAAGIRVGEVRTHRVVGGLARRLGVIEGDGSGGFPELGSLFGLTAGAAEPSVSWFFVRDVEGVLGIAGGIPGAQGIPGTATSGLAVSSELVGGEISLGSVLVHETGHFLGLFHATELDGTVLDPFADTPACGPERDGNRDGVLEYGECRGAGAENAMFWGTRNDRELSPSQRALLGRALVLR